MVSLQCLTHPVKTRGQTHNMAESQFRKFFGYFRVAIVLVLSILFAVFCWNAVERWSLQKVGSAVRWEHRTSFSFPRVTFCTILKDAGGENNFIEKVQHPKFVDTDALETGWDWFWHLCNSSTFSRSLHVQSSAMLMWQICHLQGTSQWMPQKRPQLDGLGMNTRSLPSPAFQKQPVTTWRQIQLGRHLTECFTRWLKASNLQFYN